jgi:hypothetical protein
MSVAKKTRVERRELVERLLTADHELSDRAVARQAGASHTLVGKVRRELVAAGVVAARSGRPGVATQEGHGNLLRQPAGEPGPALKHGASSEATLAEVSARHLVELRKEFPQASERILLLQAGRLARLEVLMGFFGDMGMQALVDRQGKPRATTLLMGQLENSVERTHRELSGEGASGDGAADPYEAYRRIVEERGGGNGDGD